MKTKTTIFSLAIGLLIAQNASAYQLQPLKKNLFPNAIESESLKPVKQELIFYPLTFFISGFELGTEFETRKNNTLRVSAGYFMSYTANTYNQFGNFNAEYDNMEGFRSEVQYRFYSRDFSAPDNFFIGIYGVYKNISLSGLEESSDYNNGILVYTPVTYKADAFSLGTVLGYRTRFYDIFSMDFFFGGGITPTNIGNTDETHLFVFPFKKSINMRLGLTLGIKI
ncbi:MAG: DUF3575 domain-containing protein [Bacteroidetes bacterium]|nr:DUF3575 domain-containing protein [Bacteroidota bacterium]